MVSHVAQQTGLDFKDFMNDFRWTVKNCPFSHGIALDFGKRTHYGPLRNGQRGTHGPIDEVYDAVFAFTILHQEAN